MTERLAHWIGRQSLEYTYAEIAKQVNVDEKTIRNIFAEYVAGLEMQFKRETPPWLGISIQEKVRIKKKQKFEEIGMARYMCLAGSFNDDYETKIQTRQGNLGTDLPTLLDLLNKDQF